MKPLEIRPDFTIEDIHKIREHNVRVTKNMTKQEKMDYYNEGGRKVQRILQERKAYQLALENTKYNTEGKAVVEQGDEWREETEWEGMFKQLKNE